MAQRPEAQRSEPNDSVLVKRLHIWQIQAVRDLLFVAAVLGLVWAGYALRAVTVPLLVALLLAYLFEPLIEKLCRHPKVKRPHAVAAVLATAGIAVLALLAIALPLIIGQTTKFIDDVREGEFRAKVAQLGPYVPEAYADQFQTVLDLLPGEAGAASDVTNEVDAQTNDNQPGGAETDDAQEAPRKAQGPVNAALMSDEQYAQLKDELRAELLAELSPPTDDEANADWLNIARGSAQAIFGVIGAIVQLGLVAFLIPFYFFFFSLWYPDVVKFGRELVPNKNREHTFELAAKMDHVVAGFVRGRIVISIIMGIMLAIGWMFCGVPYAIALGLIVGIFCAVPYLGVIGIPLAVGLLFFDQLGLTPEQAFSERHQSFAGRIWDDGTRKHVEKFSRNVGRWLTRGYLRYGIKTTSSDWKSIFRLKKDDVLLIDGRPIQRESAYNIGAAVSTAGIRCFEAMTCPGGRQAPLQALSFLYRNYRETESASGNFSDVFEVPHRVRKIVVGHSGVETGPLTLTLSGPKLSPRTVNSVNEANVEIQRIVEGTFKVEKVEIKGRRPSYVLLVMDYSAMTLNLRRNELWRCADRRFSRDIDDFYHVLDETREYITLASNPAQAVGIKLLRPSEIDRIYEIGFGQLGKIKTSFISISTFFPSFFTFSSFSHPSSNLPHSIMY
ncbi:MAG: AI-2E family transporter [Planctomycetes bacterium]|nr:AI-2E family transporter [Planctomycetota bacterium]